MHVKAFIINFLLSVGLFIFSFYLAWLFSAQVNFFYSIWYQVLDIDQAIEVYAPKNKYKNDFDKTDRKERIRLFAEIVKGIQNNGAGLEEIAYKDKARKNIDTLLTNDEVIHLKDVAHLINALSSMAIGTVIICLLALFLIYNLKIQVSKIKNHLFGGLGAILIFVSLVIIVGPTKIFYLGHELIFPKNHQWFFYYEESLMSTMMKAPVLFGPIALQLLLLTMFLWLMLLVLFRKLTKLIT